MRIIAATSRDLAEDVKRGGFRGDLFYRLNVLPIHIPPLRERKEDIPRLLEFFLQKHNEKLNSHIKGIAPQVMSELLEYPWYGNVRELENTVERGMILTDSDWINKFEFGLTENMETTRKPQSSSALAAALCSINSSNMDTPREMNRQNIRPSNLQK